MGTGRDDQRNSENTGRVPVQTGNSIAGVVAAPSVQSGVIHGGVHIHQDVARATVPWQLPPPAAYFADRSPEMARVDQVAGGTGRPGLVVLTGTGGVGKTALAVAWAARNAARFPDGQLYADVRGFSAEGAVSTEQVLGGFLRGLGVPPDRVPVELAEQTALFRSLTTRRGLLVLVDNAVSAAQVRPLVPASEDSMVLVTSRLRLSGLHMEGAEFVELLPLPHEQAVDLVIRSLGARRVGTERAAVGELVSLCGRLPIALRVVGARLAARPRWPVARVVAELRDERHRLAKLAAYGESPVHAAFDLSYQALHEKQARLYRLASAHPGPEFDVGVAAAAADMAKDDAEDALQALVDASLLEEVDSDRYRYHDLVRLHARDHPDQSSEEVDRARRSIAEWFLHSATRANLVVIPNRWRVSEVAQHYRGAEPPFERASAAVDWLDGQLPNLLAVLTDAAERGWDDLAWQVCEALWELFLYRKHYQQWIASHRIGIPAAQRCGNTVAESRLRCQLGRAYLDLHRFDEARTECARALDLARHAGSRTNESVALYQLGMAAQGRGDTEDALARFRASLAIEDELGIPRGVALRHRRIGEALLAASRLRESAVELESARDGFEAMSDHGDAAKVDIALARVEAQVGGFEPALARLERALTVLRDSGSASYQVDALLALGEIRQQQGELDVAEGHFTEARRLAGEVGGPQLERAEARLRGLRPDDGPQLGDAQA
ncbi:tetratricopeptide repeat protein [Actinokineospora sp. NBRC 105648]|uniref:tetratricopeptide repeat protein n=1 Tax=Actinokineospora sp. NBRC 105648 TaxID=3032206 RepID=UPI0024A5418F|nr:tetratricopeptide repeat protein [Actinokineospora sp. NBRC 105648]GLZ42509.1 NTPase [Actinokineospora sp. NBRC 105648]